MLVVHSSIQSSSPPLPRRHAKARCIVSPEAEEVPQVSVEQFLKKTTAQATRGTYSKKKHRTVNVCASPCQDNHKCAPEGHDDCQGSSSPTERSKGRRKHKLQKTASDLINDLSDYIPPKQSAPLESPSQRLLLLPVYSQTTDKSRLRAAASIAEPSPRHFRRLNVFPEPAFKEPETRNRLNTGSESSVEKRQQVAGASEPHCVVNHIRPPQSPEQSLSKAQDLSPRYLPTSIPIYKLENPPQVTSRGLPLVPLTQPSTQAVP